MRTNSLLAGLMALPLFAIACSSSKDAGQATDDLAGECKDGATKSCKCEDGAKSEKTCSDGSWGSCDCGGSNSTDPKPEEKPVVKPTCTELASCDSATAPGSFAPASFLDVKFEPLSKAQLIEQLRADVANATPRARYLAAILAQPQKGEAEEIAMFREIIQSNVKLRDTLARHLPTLGFGDLDTYRNNFPAVVRTSQVMADTTSTCSPALTIRLAKILVTEEDDDFANDEVYCSISAATKTAAEQLITPKTRALDEGKSQTFTGVEAVIWGKDGPRESDGDMTLSYDCYETDAANGYAEFVQKAAENVRKLGPKILPKGAQGYVAKGADIAEALAKILPTILALDNDDHLFVARQVIPASKGMELAKGATWGIRKKGKNLNSDWDWTLTMEAWGCAGSGTGDNTNPK